MTLSSISALNAPKSLTQAAERFGTDKLEHGYIPYYEKHLPENVTDLLEIGCFQGASLRLWAFKYPTADIHTIDLFGDAKNMTIREARDQGFIPYRGDQKDDNFLFNTIKTQFDVIIDDGSHNSHDQQVSFIRLFQSNLKPGGIYVIEDLHCCKEPFYWGKDIDNFGDTFLGVIKKRISEGSAFLDNKYFSQDPHNHMPEPHPVNSFIDSIYLYDDKIAFITKR